jgi:hypothetical protein
MPKLGLGLGLTKPIVVGGSTPVIPQDGLSLWLKADAGVSTSQSQYVSRIVLSGTGESVFNGTYTAISTPDFDGVYYFESSTGKTMLYNGPNGGGEYQAYDNPALYIYYSNDGTNWSLTGSVRPSTITISNANVSGANGTYTYDGWNGDAMVWTKDDYHIVCYPGQQFSLYYDFGGNLYLSPRYFGELPTGTWTDDGAGGTCTSTAVSFPTGAVPTGVTTTSAYGPVNVNEWEDQSVNGRNAMPIDSPPAYTPVAINNKPAILFSDDALRLLSFSNTGFYPKTIFVVGTASQDQAYRTMVGGNSEGILGNYYLQTRANITQPAFTLSNTDELTYVAFANSLALNTPYLLGGYSDFVSNVYAFKNGVVGSGEIAQDQLQRTLTTGYIGGGYYDGGPADFWNGYIAEVIIYNRVLTTIERQQVEAYLNTKYAIY